MKKMIFLVFLTLGITAFGAYKDGEYYVESDKAIFHWKPFTKMVVKNGEIVEVQHDRHKKGQLASNDKGYNKSMMSKFGSSPEMYAKKLPENFFKADKNLDNMDGISGATDSYNQFKIMMKFLMDKAENCEPGRYTIEKSKLEK